MARTKSENFEDVREQILTSAARLFAEKGFQNTNIIEIGQACKASKSRMYHYFASKETILEEMLVSHVSTLVHAADGLVRSSAPPRTKFRDFVLLHLRYYYDHRDRHTVLIEDADHLPDAARSVVNAAEHKLVTFLVGILQELNPDRFKEKHVSTSHAMLIFGMLNWTYTWYRPTGKLSLDGLADQVTELCLKGVL